MDDRERQHRFSVMQFDEVCHGKSCNANKAMPHHSAECKAEHDTAYAGIEKARRGTMKPAGYKTRHGQFYGSLTAMPVHERGTAQALYAIPEGWTLVPKEPTPAMLDAANRDMRQEYAALGIGDGSHLDATKAARSYYAAMLDAVTPYAK